MTQKHLLAVALTALALQACCAPQPTGPASGPDGHRPPPPGQGHRPPEPPAEAFKACEGKTEGAAISITMRDGKTMAATCAKFGDKLAARPNDMPPPRGQQEGQPQK
jgi:hypothetical protein